MHLDIGIEREIWIGIVLVGQIIYHGNDGIGF